MRVLHVTYESAPKQLATGGTILGTFQNLAALVELGNEVHVAVLGTTDPAGDEVRSRAATVRDIPRVRTPIALRPLERVLNPETFTLRFPSSHGFAGALDRLSQELAPDIIWTDTIFPLAFAPRGRFPTVWGNYDFLFKLKRVRKHTRARKLRRPDAMTVRHLERFELAMAREAAHVMCVSASENDFLVGSGIASTYIPIVGPTIPTPDPSFDGPPRFFLFGNHNTAHAAALSEIRNHLWPALAAAGVRCEWHQIGKPPAKRDDDWLWMESTFDRVHGFVDDLSTVMRSGDVSVMPYRFDTGFRTKFAVAAGYGVTSAGYCESFKCAPEFSAGRDSIAEPDVAGLVRAFERVIADRAWRAQIGAGARATYERAFTFEAQLPRYADVIAAAAARGPASPAS